MPKTLPPFDPDKREDHLCPSNGERAIRAAEAVTVWRGREAVDESDLADLLSDLMHLAHRDRVDFNEQLARAQRNFAAES